jgi:hypothetical protein
MKDRKPDNSDGRIAATVVIFLLVFAALIYADRPGSKAPAPPAPSASYDNGTITTLSPSSVQAFSCEDGIANLPAVADRLGVGPLPTDKIGNAKVILSMCDGRTYDFLELINALLDKMAAASAPTVALVPAPAVPVPTPPSPPEIAPAAPAPQAEARVPDHPRYYHPKSRHAYQRPSLPVSVEPCATWQAEAGWCTPCGAQPGPTEH